MRLRIAPLAAVAITAGALLCSAALAQNYPSRPIRVLVPAQAGGIGDILPRIVGQKLAETGTTLIVENRTGGAGVIAAEAVAKAPPDGYLLLMGNQGQLSIRPLLAKLPYDAARILRRSR
jgi:tripartite-type tricarboxylate transporter receptor subunit TctC